MPHNSSPPPYAPSMEQSLAESAGRLLHLAPTPNSNVAAVRAFIRAIFETRQASLGKDHERSIMWFGVEFHQIQWAELVDAIKHWGVEERNAKLIAADILIFLTVKRDILGIPHPPRTKDMGSFAQGWIGYLVLLVIVAVVVYVTYLVYRIFKALFNMLV